MNQKIPPNPMPPLSEQLKAIDENGGETYEEYLAGYHDPVVPLTREQWEARQERGAAEGWTPWYGGECPVPPGSWFQYRLRDGSSNGPLVTASVWEWGHHNSPYDIVAYRIISPPSAQRAIRARGLHPAPQWMRQHEDGS